jgi:hypothetical protein
MVDSLSQAAFARYRRVTRKTVTIWKQKGFVVLDARGNVEVQRSDALLDARPECSRGGMTNRRPAAACDFADSATITIDDVPPALIAEAADWSLAEASRKKEIALALLRQLEFDRECGSVVSIAAVAATVTAEYVLVRDRVLQIPGKLADELVGLDRRAIETRLRAEMYEALAELHNPAYEGRPSVDRPSA